MLNVEKLNHISWECIHFINLESTPNIETIDNPFYISLKNITSKSEFLCSIGRTLRFPDYYEPNWDAFEECIKEDSVFTASNPIILIIKEYTEIWQNDPQIIGTFISICLSTASYFSKSDRPFHVIFCT